jgi:hypothetical protein
LGHERPGLRRADGAETVRLIQTMLSQLTVFSVPSTSFAKLPPDPLNEYCFTLSGGFVVTFRRISSTCSCLEIWKVAGFLAE